MRIASAKGMPGRRTTNMATSLPSNVFTHAHIHAEPARALGCDVTIELAGDDEFRMRWGLGVCGVEGRIEESKQTPAMCVEWSCDRTLSAKGQHRESDRLGQQMQLALCTF